MKITTETIATAREGWHGPVHQLPPEMVPLPYTAQPFAQLAENGRRGDGPAGSDFDLWDYFGNSEGALL